MDSLHHYFISKYGQRKPPEGWESDMKRWRETKEWTKMYHKSDSDIAKFLSMDHFVDDIDVILGFFFEMDMRSIIEQHTKKCILCRTM